MSFFPAFKIPLRPLSAGHANEVQISKKLVDSARTDIDSLLEHLNTTLIGLSQEENRARLEKYGPNEVAREKNVPG